MKLVFFAAVALSACGPINDFGPAILECRGQDQRELCECLACKRYGDMDGNYCKVRCERAGVTK